MLAKNNTFTSPTLLKFAQSISHVFVTSLEPCQAPKTQVGGHSVVFILVLKSAKQDIARQQCLAREGFLTQLRLHPPRGPNGSRLNSATSLVRNGTWWIGLDLANGANLEM